MKARVFVLKIHESAENYLETILIPVSYTHLLNAAHAGSNGGFRANLEQSNLSRIRNMRAAAELAREIIHRDNAHNVSVFFTEERHGAKLACFLDRHFTAVNRNTLKNFLIDQLLHLSLIHI